MPYGKGKLLARREVGKGCPHEVVGRQRPWDRGSGGGVTGGNTPSGLLTPWRAFHSWELGWSAHPTPDLTLPQFLVREEKADQVMRP